MIKFPLPKALRVAVLGAAAVVAAMTAPVVPAALAQANQAPVAAVVVDLEISKRKVAGEQVIRVTQGDTVVLRWTVDEEVELHLHGYDVEANAAPGAPATMRFEARATGRFPVTSHGFGGHSHHGESALVYIEVHPK
jgi:FtsP/CotA-like multicopper oxidase with cupredoxin domain